MVEGDFVVRGSSTLSASAPGVAASVVVTATGAAAGDTVMLTPTSAMPRSAVNKDWGLYVTNITANAFTVNSSEELPADVTFDWIVWDAV